MKQSFESLNDYQKTNIKYLVSESLILEKGEDESIFGKVIDRGLSFVPRAMRFKKAKKVMQKSLIEFVKKAKSIIKKFDTTFNEKIKIIDTEYRKLVDEKISPLLKDDKTEEALSILENQRKELEEYKKEQMNILNKSIDDILTPYTNSIEKRIDSPGFVLNVELSEKGKGELRAKWQELAASQKLELDKDKTNIIKSSGYKRLDEMIAEVTKLIAEIKNKERLKNLDFYINYITDKGNNVYDVKVQLRTSGARLNVIEKGVIIGSNPNKLEYSSGANIVKLTGTYAYSAQTFSVHIKNVSKDDYVRPYLIDKNSKHPIYGDVGRIDELIQSGEASKSSIKGAGMKAAGELDAEEEYIKNK